jgi:hypothetical protein
VRRFIERFALAMSEAGMPRMPSRGFAAILSAEDGRCTAAELAEVLGVSPAAVSGAVRYLLQVQLIAILARWEQDLEEGIKAVGPDTPAGDRLEETRGFYAFLREELARILHDWREQRTAERPGHPGA